MADSSQNLTVRLTFVPATDRATPARAGEVARAAAADLSIEGYKVAPAKTGERGGVAYDLIMEAAKAVHDNKEMLLALVGLATPIVKYLLDWYQKKNGASSSQPQDFEVVVVVDGVAATARSAAEASDTALLQQLLVAQPSLSNIVTVQSQLNITVKVPPKPKPARRPR